MKELLLYDSTYVMFKTHLKRQTSEQRLPRGGSLWTGMGHKGTWSDENVRILPGVVSFLLQTEQ